MLPASDKWEDRTWNRDYADGEREWDAGSTNNRYRDRSYDDDLEAEKEDSDTESNHNHTNIRNYHDADKVSSPTEKRVNLNLNPSISKSPSKTNKVLKKKVDLGAAANFGIRDATQSPVPQTGNNLLSDDFNPREGDLSEPKSEFGDFEAAFGGSTSVQKGDADDFADFSSAFAVSNQPPSTQQMFQPASLLGNSPQSNLINPGKCLLIYSNFMFI